MSRAANAPTPLDRAPVCDSVISEGWYRVISDAGGKMPTKCVPKGQCGTVYPIWLKGMFIRHGLIVDHL